MNLQDNVLKPSAMRYFMVGSLLLVAMTARGQYDSISVTEEVMPVGMFPTLVKQYNQIIRADVEELNLLKVDLLGLALSAFSNEDEEEFNVLGLAFESKIDSRWSWIVGGHIRSNQEEVTRIEVEGGGRFYYNMKNRMLKGKSANNFSANYFALMFNGQSDLINDDFRSSLRVAYGIQRRIGKYGFVDFSLGVDGIFDPLVGHKTRIETYADFMVGFAISL